MQKNLVAFLCVCGWILTACGNENALRKRSAAGRLTPEQYGRLVDLNKLQGENIEAREFAYGNLVGANATSEKAKAMAEKISAPNCQVQGSIPASDLTVGVHEQTISGAGCPIYWFRRSAYTLPEKIVNQSDRLVIVDEKYRKDFSAMNARAIAGSYNVVAETNGYRVTGLLDIIEFSTVQYGRIDGTIRVEHRNISNEGGGFVTLALTSLRGWNHSATIQWALRRGTIQDVQYRIDNVQVEANEFDELFSSYQLDKYMANALKMK